VAISEPDGHHVKSGLRQRSNDYLVEADLEILFVDVNPQIAVIVIIIFRQQKVFHLCDVIFNFKVFHLFAIAGFHRRLP